MSTLTSGRLQVRLISLINRLFSFPSGGITSLLVGLIDFQVEQEEEWDSPWETNDADWKDLSHATRLDLSNADVTTHQWWLHHLNVPGSLKSGWAAQNQKRWAPSAHSTTSAQSLYVEIT